MRETSPLGTMTVEEYFRFEESSPIRHEYVSGEVYAMTGATARHGRIVMNVAQRVGVAAGDGPCEVFVENMRVAAANDTYYYPDIMVNCAALGDLEVVAPEPCVVVEVTSPDSARVDRGEKLDRYRRIPGLRAYLIVDHRRRRVERHWRASDADEWRREEIVGEGRVVVPCVDVELTLDEIYRRVELPAVGEPEADYGAEYEPVNHEDE
jgi:Uma2 family endonuclease